MTDYYSLFPSFKKEIPKFFDQSKSFAVIPVKNNPDSIGYKIFKNLKNNFNVFPISQEKELLGEECYSNISQLKEINSVIIVTKPEKTLAICKECFQNNITNLWIEMGSESEEALKFCKENNIKTIFLHSVLKERINPSTKYNFKEES